MVSVGSIFYLCYQIMLALGPTELEKHSGLVALVNWTAAVEGYLILKAMLGLRGAKFFKIYFFSWNFWTPKQTTVIHEVAHLQHLLLYLKKKKYVRHLFIFARVDNGKSMIPHISSFFDKSYYFEYRADNITSNPVLWPTPEVWCYWAELHVDYVLHSICFQYPLSFSKVT